MGLCGLTELQPTIRRTRFRLSGPMFGSIHIAMRRNFAESRNLMAVQNTCVQVPDFSFVRQGQVVLAH